MSRRYLFALIEGGGNVPPVLGLARRLAARGHQVRVLGDPAIASDARAFCLDLAARQATSLRCAATAT